MTQRGDGTRCHSIGHEDRPGTQKGIFDDGEGHRQEPITYCDECAELMAREFTPYASAKGAAVCGRSFRSGSGRYYDCGRSPDHEGGHALSEPPPTPVRDAVDAEAARLWAERHNDHSGPFWQASCPACTAIPAEAFRLGYRAGLQAVDR